VADEKPIRAGARAALPLVVPTIALGVSFGLLAEPVMGSAAPIAMSILVFSGGAQFAALSVLQANGTAAAAIGAGLLMNTRWLPMSFALTPSLRGGRPRRALEAQAIVDASFVLSDRRDGSFDRGLLIGATIPQAGSWIAGTIIGVTASGSFEDPDQFGLDAVFPAFYVTLLLAEAKGRRALTAAAIAAALTLALMVFAPPGVPVIAASAAALIGLRRR
jgi:predicted branched-subunit amino acid permease